MPILPGYVHEYSQHHLDLEKPALHLISLLFADKELKRAYRSCKYKYLEQFAEEHKESEVIRLTVSIATGFRLTHWNAKQKPTPAIVGQLWEGEKNMTWADLTMIEACNKVIHAEQFAFESRRFPRTEEHFLKPRLHLAGTKGKKEWIAVIDVLDFANYAIQPISPLFPDPLDLLFSDQESAT